MNSLTTISLLYTIPYGLGAALRLVPILAIHLRMYSSTHNYSIKLIRSISCLSTRVSNELGAGKPQAARAAVCVGMIITIMETTIVSTSLFALRRILGYAYSNEEEVINYVIQMVPLICISVIMDSIQGVLSGDCLNSYPLNINSLQFFFDYKKGDNLNRFIWKYSN